MHKKIRLAPSHHPSSSETMNPSSSFDNYYYSKRSKSKYPVAGTSSSTVKENGNYHIAVDLRSPKNKSKEDDLGERIKYIKSQLTSFTSNNHRSETASYNNATPARSSVHNVCRSDPRHHSSYGYSSRNYDSNASLSHSFHGLGGTSVMNGYAKSTVIPATQGFSDWLNSTIDSLADPVQTSAVRHGHYPVMTNYSMSCSTGGYATVGFPYQTSYIYYPHHHSVERLLYESFLMQNFDLYVPSSDEAIAEVALLSSTSLTKDKNPVHGGMGHLHSHSTRHRHSHRRQNDEHRNDKRHRRATWRIHYSSDSDVEVINVDDGDFSAEYFNEGEPNEESMENNNNNNDDNNNYSDSDNNNNVNNDNNNNNNNMNINNNNNNNNNNNDNGDGNDDDVNSNVSQSFSPPPTNAENDFVPDFDEPTIPWFDQPSFSNYSPEPDDAIEVDKKEDTNETKEENESINVKPQPNGSDSKKRVWECPICFEQNTGQEIVTTMCGHIFCKDCIENYYSTSAHSCPSCRADLRNKPLITLFNF